MPDIVDKGAAAHLAIRALLRMSGRNIGAALFVIVFSALHAFAQPAQRGLTAATSTHDAHQIVLGKAAVELTGPWKFHTGDDPRWADPGFNDSAWGAMDLTPPAGSVDPSLGSSGYIPGWTANGFPGYSGYAWYRLRFHIMAGQSQLALLMPIDVDDAYQVFWNGKLMGDFGNFHHQPPRTYYGQPMLFRLPIAAAQDPTQTMTLALRFYMKAADLLEDPTPGGLHEPPQLGLAPVVGTYYRLQRSVLARTYNFYSIPILLYVLAGLAAFALYAVDRTQRIFLWLGAAGLLNALYLAFTLAAILTTVVDDRLLILRPVLFSFMLWTWMMTIYVWLELGGVRWLWKAIYGLTAVHIALQLAQGLLYGRTAFPFLLSGPWEIATTLTSLLTALLAVAMLYYAWRQRSREGHFATLALIFLLLAVFPDPLVWLHVPLLWFVSGIQVSTRICLELAVWLWVFLLFVLRFQESQRRQHHLHLEMRQAQQIQHMLLPEPAQALPGLPSAFHVESVYRPAAEVGGDFFQVLPDGAGGLWVVIGDVSGKGLRAAMLVSLIVGTLRTLAEQDLSPGELLQGMNRRLHNRMEGGFATCICARLTAGGEMLLANAGHLPPYLNGEELPIPAGLPLGIVANLEYEECITAIPPRGRLVFLTDGIVEARNHKRELYGFDRTKALVDQPVEEIARTAERFGQNDDITVIALMWAAAPTAPDGSPSKTKSRLNDFSSSCN